MANAVVFDTYILGHLAGKLSMSDEGGAAKISFSYLDDYKNVPGRVPLSSRFPIDGKDFSEREIFIFLQNLFPEGSVREKINDILHIESDDDIQVMIERMGSDIAGAIEFYIEGYEHPVFDPMDGVAHLNEEALSGLINDIEAKPFNVGDLQGRQTRMSLAGAQPKIPISGQFNAAGELIAFEPVNGLVSTYIIKPPRSDNAFPALVLNEYLCMTAAANSGLDIPEVRLINYMNSHGESPVEDTAFVIKRFDRVVYSDKPDGTPFSFINTEKVHQEDLCQSVGHSPSKKYEYEDGHRVGAGMAELFDIVSEICDTPAKDKQELLYRIFFNFIIGNDDAHSKNFSFLHTGKKLKLSPAYDIVSTQAYENLTSRDYQLQHTMAMAIGTARETSKLTPEDLSIFEAHCKIRLKPIKRKLLAFIDRAMSEVEKATKLVIESHAFLESEKRLLNRIHEVSDANGKVLRKAVYHYTNS